MPRQETPRVATATPMPEDNTNVAILRGTVKKNSDKPPVRCSRCKATFFLAEKCPSCRAILTLAL